MNYLKRPELQLPLYFVIISIIWIVCSDILFLKVLRNTSSFQLTQIQSIKGCCYVSIVALFLHITIKSSNKKLAKSHEEFKDLFYNVPDPMLVIDLKTQKFDTVNKAAIETYGYTTEEFTQLGLDDLRLQESDYENHLKVSSCKLHKHRKKNNEVLIAQESTREISLKNQPACLLSAMDVTEHEQAKAALLQRENQLQQILNSITDGFFIIAPDLTVNKANEQFKILVEVPVENVEGKKLPELFPSLCDGESFTRYLTALEKHDSIHFETNHKNTGRWYRVSAYPFEGGLSVFFRDVTKEKDDELQLYQNQQNMVAIINNTDDLIWSIDNNYRYFTYNESYREGYQKLFGEDLWIGKSALNDKANYEHYIKWKKLYDRALKGEKFCIDMDFTINNDCYFTTVRFNPIYNSKKEVSGVGCFLQNITERRLHEKKIEQQNEKLKEIAYITSHKVRVPLANILGLTEVLDTEHPLSHSNSQIIDHLKTSARLLDATICNMVKETTQME